MFENVVMVAMGEHYRRMAAITVPLVERHLDCVVHLVVDGYADGFEAKLSLLESAAGPILFIDADALVVSWDSAPFDTELFSAVHDYPCPGWAPDLSELFDVHRAVNSGVWMATPAHAPVFALARKLRAGELASHPRLGGDQTALNRALFLSEVEVNFLPKEYNWQVNAFEQVDPQCGAHVFHIVGNSREFGAGSVDSAMKWRRLETAASALGVL